MGWLQRALVQGWRNRPIGLIEFNLMVDAKYLANAKQVLEKKKAEIRARLKGVGGRLERLQPEDRSAFSCCVELVQLISRFELLQAIGATDELSSAAAELLSAVKRSGLADASS